MDDDFDKTVRLNRAELAAKFADLGLKPRAATQATAPAPVTPRDSRSSAAPRTFHVLTHLATGGMAIVHHARRISDNREVALKVLTPHNAESSMMRARFEREIRLLRQFNHPHIVGIVDADPDPEHGPPWVALEYCPNGSLGALLRSSPAGVSVPRAIQLVRQVGLALECLHTQGVVHRDLKPDNVLLAHDGSAKLSDLGIAHTHDHDAHDVTLTVTGDVLGTRGYLAPEQRAGQRAVDARTDIWALGGLAWELLTGEPCPESEAELADQIQLKRPEVSEPVMQAILGCREPRVEARWNSVTALLGALHP